jgi:hypothetical protein
MKKIKNTAKRKNKKKKQELAGTRVKLSLKKHLVPPLAGFMVAVLVFGFFNSSLLSARIAYYIQQHHPKTYASTAQVAGTPIDKGAHNIKIEKINVDAPVIYDQKVVNESAFLQALHNGVVHYPNTAFPGQQGNVVIFGHSSGQWWAPGNYKFVFTLLDKAVIGDRIFLDYQGKGYPARPSPRKLTGKFRLVLERPEKLILKFKLRLLLLPTPLRSVCSPKGHLNGGIF